MPESLQDQVAVVTGASSGIGLAIAQALAAEGAQLVLGARSQPKLDEAVATLGGAAVAVRTDVTDTADVEALIGTAIERHGRIDILIANAGVYTGGDFADADPAELLGLIDTNVGGIVRTVHAALGHMIPAGTGNIVITSSVSGHQVIAWEPVYSASKHAVHALAHGIRRQLIGTGVRIGSVAPGVVLNDLWKVTDAAAVAAGVAAGTGLRSQDVADAVLYMLTRPSHVNIRDLVILPVNQEIWGLADDLGEEYHASISAHSPMSRARHHRHRGGPEPTYHGSGARIPGQTGHHVHRVRDKSFRPVINVTHDAHVAVVRPEEAGPAPC